MTNAIQLASKQDFEERNNLMNNPNCMAEDEHGNPAKPWQIDLNKRFLYLQENRKWSPTVVEQSGKYGVWDQFHERYLVPVEYDEIGALEELGPYMQDFQMPLVVRKSDKWGMISPKDNHEILLPFEYDAIKEAYSGWVLKKDGLFCFLYGKIDLHEFKLVECFADDIIEREEISYVMYRKDGKYGFLNPLTEAIFDTVQLEKKEDNARIYVTQNGTGGFLSEHGEFIPKEELSKWSDESILRTWYYFPFSATY